jgi:hypothetical protein
MHPTVRAPYQRQGRAMRTPGGARVRPVGGGAAARPWLGAATTRARPTAVAAMVAVGPAHRGGRATSGRGGPARLPLRWRPQPRPTPRGGRAAVHSHPGVVAGAAQDSGRGAALARHPPRPLAGGRLVPAGLPAPSIPQGRGPRCRGAGAAGGAVPGPSWRLTAKPHRPCRAPASNGRRAEPLSDRGQEAVAPEGGRRGRLSFRLSFHQVPRGPTGPH